VTLTATRKFDHNHHIIFDCVCTNQDGQKVIAAPPRCWRRPRRSSAPRIELPEVTIVDREARYQHLLDRTRGLSPIPMAVAHPCDAESLLGVVWRATRPASSCRPWSAPRKRSAPWPRSRASTSPAAPLIDVPSTATPPPGSPWRWRAKAAPRR
jgi:hypothetical protein